MTGQLKNKVKITPPADAKNGFSHLLHNNKWFNCLPEEIRDTVLKEAEIIQFAKDDYIFRSSDLFNGIYAVLEGSVQLSYVDTHGNQAVAAIADPVMWFGEISLVDSQPRTHDAICVKKSTILFLNKHMLDTLFKHYPKFWFHIAQLTSHKLRMLCAELISIQTQSLQQRLTHRLWFILNGYGNHRQIENLTISITQEQLASMLFCARQSINLELQHLEKENIIRLAFKKIEILDLARLKQLAGCIQL
jgi:CRP/FNR family transcriptional regulator, cyclic AMP receptor protein